MKELSRADILAVDDLKKEKLSVPEWGGEIYIRTMNGMERDGYEEWAAGAGRSLKGIRGRLAALCIVNAAGERLFSDEDIPALGQKSAAALERVVKAAMRLNAVTDDDVKELEKN